MVVFVLLVDVLWCSTWCSSSGLLFGARCSSCCLVGLDGAATVIVFVGGAAWQRVADALPAAAWLVSGMLWHWVDAEWIRKHGRCREGCRVDPVLLDKGSKLVARDLLLCKW